MVPAIGVVMVATDTTMVVIGMRSRGGWVYTLRLITVLTTIPHGGHGITVTVVAIGRDVAARTGADAATILAA